MPSRRLWKGQVVIASNAVVRASVHAILTQPRKSRETLSADRQHGSGLVGSAIMYNSPATQFLAGTEPG